MTLSTGWFTCYPVKTAALLSAPHNTCTKTFHPTAQTQKRVCWSNQWTGMHQGAPIVGSRQRAMEQSHPPVVVSTIEIYKFSSWSSCKKKNGHRLCDSSFFLFFLHVFVENCTKQRSYRPILLRLTMKMWIKMRLVMVQ